ncbi:MAG: DUF3592 domain-containing protein, partial [Planctomycetia bacterium]|nr:DUF3592 domain-containing protein [Planctomycetia bacterium]
LPPLSGSLAAELDMDLPSTFTPLPAVPRHHRSGVGRWLRGMKSVFTPSGTTSKRARAKASTQPKIKRRRVMEARGYPVWDASPFEPFVFLVAKLIVLATGVIAAPFLEYAAINWLNKASASQTWSHTEMAVLSTEVTAQSHRYGTTYIPNVRYRYRVNGADYVGTRIAFYELGGSEDHAQTTIRDYAVGTRHRVYYDPAHPADSVLRNDWTNWLYLALLIPCLIFIFPLLAAVRHIQEIRTRIAFGSLAAAIPDKKEPLPVFLIILGVVIVIMAGFVVIPLIFRGLW